MSLAATARAEAPLAAKYSLVAVIGFLTDFIVLKLAVHAGVEPAWARVISLTCAMQATFWINGLLVFRCLSRDGWMSAWLGYTATNGFGNFCNYWAFVTLVSLHHPILSKPILDLALGGLVAWAINYGCARYLIFGAYADGSDKGCTPIGEVVRNVRRRLPSALAGLSAPIKASGVRAQIRSGR